MPRKKPMLKLDTLGNFDLNPENNTSHYFASVLQDNLFIKPPNFDSPGGGIELLALQNERVYVNMLQLQEEMLENTKRQDIININRIEELYTSQAEIRKRFISANNFFKECHDKEKFAESKYSEEKQRHVEFKKSISAYKRNIEILAGFRETLKKVAKQYEHYQTLMNEVVAFSDNWSSLKDCMDKCDALSLSLETIKPAIPISIEETNKTLLLSVMTQVEICELQRVKLQEFETLRQKLIKASEEAKLEVLGLNNALSELERAYGLLVSEYLRIEDIIGHTKDTMTEQKLTTTQILDEIAIMYRLLCRKNGLSQDSIKYNIEKQCDYIREEIKVLQAVIKECKKT